MAEDITEEKVDIIVPVVTLDPANSSPRLAVPVRHFIGEDLGTVNSDSEIREEDNFPRVLRIGFYLNMSSRSLMQDVREEQYCGFILGRSGA